MWHPGDYDKIPGSRLYRRHCQVCDEPIRVPRRDRYGPATCETCNPVIRRDKPERPTCKMPLEPDFGPALIPLDRRYFGQFPKGIRQVDDVLLSRWPQHFVWSPIPGMSLIDAAKKRLAREGRLTLSPPPDAPLPRSRPSGGG